MPYLTLTIAAVIALVAERTAILGMADAVPGYATDMLALGAALAVGKLTAAAVLHTTDTGLRWPLRAVVAGLMVITAGGNYAHFAAGYLGTQSDATLADTRIAPLQAEQHAAEDREHDARVDLAEMDARLAEQRGRMEFTRAAANQQAQASRRAELSRQIETARATIVRTTAEIADLRATQIAASARTGPISYVAVLIHATDTDAVARAAILLLACLPDPLALLLIAVATRMLTDSTEPDDASPEIRDAEIRRQYAAGVNRAQLARGFGLSWGQVNRIVSEGEN